MRYFISVVIDQYESWIIRWYARIRFLIININMLDVLLTYIPRKGRLVTLGCGFGLFECVIALVNPELEIVGYDWNARRIVYARKVAQRLNLRNVWFVQADVTQDDVRDDSDCVLMLDLLHHVAPENQVHILTRCQQMLGPNGVLIVKDIHRGNALKLAFAWLLDKLMTKNEPVYYFDQATMRKRLASLDFHTLVLPINDWLPYPHIAYIGFKGRS